MGRPASNGAPSFRFNSAEVTEMESILHAHKFNVPEREFCQTLAGNFSRSADREGKVVVQMKQIWNWFQNRRYAIRAKNSRAPGKLNVAPSQRNDPATVRNVSQALLHVPVPQASSVNNVLQVPHPIPTHSGQNATKNGADNSQMEFEAKSSRDGAWYDVSSFLSHRSLENDGPAVLVRFVGFGSEEDEWINVLKNVRLRSLPCESSECVVVLPNDLILCFQEGKEQALYYDAHVLDAQRRRHDARGCRCRFLVRYDHDQSEEIVPLRKVCRRPETDYRLQLLHAESANTNQNKSGFVHQPVPVADSTTEKKAVEIVADTTLKQPVTRVYPNLETTMAPVSFGNAPLNSAVPMDHSNASLHSASAGAVDSTVSTVPSTTVPVADNVSKQVTATTATGVIANTDTVISLFALTNTSVPTPVVTMDHSNAPSSASAMDSDVSTVDNTLSVDDSMPTMNHLNSPLAPVPVDPFVLVSVANTTTPKQPENTLNPMAEVPHASTDVNVSMAPDSHSNASLSSTPTGAVYSTVFTANNMDPTALNSIPNQPSSPGAGANTCEVTPSDAPSSPASETGAVDLSVASVATTDPVPDSSSSLTCTVGPGTLDSPVVTEITTSMEKLGSSTAIDNEGNLNSVDTHPGVTSGANNIFDVPEEPSGANNISDVLEESSGANNISDVLEEPSGANNISDVPEEPSGANNISDVPEEPSENMQIG